MKRLEGKCALITGAARGIGLAFAKKYIAEGARVAIADINIELARKVVSELGDAAVAIEMDVSKQDSIEQAVAETIGQLGQIDILIITQQFSVPTPLLKSPENSIKAHSILILPEHYLLCRLSLNT